MFFADEQAMAALGPEGIHRIGVDAHNLQPSTRKLLSQVSLSTAKVHNALHVVLFRQPAQNYGVLELSAVCSPTGV